MSKDGDMIAQCLPNYPDAGEEFHYTDEEKEEIERERKASLVDIEAWEMYVEAEKRGFNPNEAITRWYSDMPQEWESKEEALKKIMIHHDIL